MSDSSTFTCPGRSFPVSPYCSGRSKGQAAGLRLLPAVFLIPFLLLLVLLLCRTTDADAATGNTLSGAAARNFSLCLAGMEQSRFRSLKTLPAGSLREEYSARKEQMDQLRAHPVRARWRQPWEQLRDGFVSIAISSSTANLAAQALFRAGQCQEELARCSHLGEDYRMALGLYEGVARTFPGSARADDALLACATISASNLGDEGSARDYVRQILDSHPSGDAAPRARELAAGFKSPAAPRKACLDNLTWTRDSTDAVDVVLDFTAPCQVRTQLERDRKAARLILDLGDTDVVSEIRRGLAVHNSLLRSVRVQQTSRRSTRLVLSFAKVASFSVQKENGSRRAVVRVAATRTAATAARSQEPPASARTAALTHRHHTLSVITIDAGHGGSDPGTLHNDVIERQVTLDVALRVGRLLTDNGLRVVYTRKTNRYLPLARRTAIANESRSDLFLSIHVNAHANPAISGVEVYYHAPGSGHAQLVADRENGSVRRTSPALRKVALTDRVLQSRSLASSVHRGMVSRVRRSGYGVTPKGVKTASFYVLATAAMPSVLAEIGYCSNAEEAALLQNPGYRQAIAEGLAEGILAYRDSRLERITAEAKPAGNRRALR